MINLTDKYKTRCGYPVEVLCVDLTGNSPVLYTYIDDSNLKFYATATKNGEIKSINENELDLIKVTPYDHIKKGDVVWVWDRDSKTKAIQFFLEYDGHHVITARYDNFCIKCYWDNCELYQAKDEK